MRALVDRVLKICEEVSSIGACAKCGKCCESPIFLPEDRERICKHLNISKTYFEKHLAGRKPCPFLENNICKIYSLRPIVCRIYPFQLFDHGLFLVGVGSCRLATEIYRKIYDENRIKSNIVKIPLIELEKFLHIKGQTTDTCPKIKNFKKSNFSF